MKHADEILARLIEDIRGRKGLGDVWAEIDVDVRNEITHGWREIINSEFRTALLEQLREEPDEEMLVIGAAVVLQNQGSPKMGELVSAIYRAMRAVLARRLEGGT